MLTYAKMSYKLRGPQISIHTFCYQPVTHFYQMAPLVWPSASICTQANQSVAAAVCWNFLWKLLRPIYLKQSLNQQPITISNLHACCLTNYQLSVTA